MNLKSDNRKSGLTRFICQELLYEYVTDRLTPERRVEMDAFLQTCVESRRELEKLKLGLQFVSLAKKVEITDQLQSELLNFQPHWQKKFAAWTVNLSRHSWKWMPYLFAAALVIVAVAVFKPWKIKFRDDVALVEQPMGEPKNGETIPILPAAAVSDAIAPAVTPPSGNPLVNNEAPNILPLPKQGTPSVAPAPSPAPSAQPPPIAQVSTTKAPVVVSQSTVTTPAKVPPADESAHEKGWLFREEIEVTGFDKAWPAIRDKIVALDGKVAGSVELGWLRQENESYFHFSLPESNQKEFEIFLKTFGPVRISKERHSRVMPEGQIRIILTVKDGSTYDEGPAETP